MKINNWIKMLKESKNYLFEAHEGYETSMLKDSKNKKGFELKRGDKVIIIFPKDRMMFSYIYRIDDTKRQNRMMILTQNLYKYVKGATKLPGHRSLEKMVSDGIAKSVLGKRVEPDGYDSYGSPSWLIVLGLI